MIIVRRRFTNPTLRLTLALLFLTQQCGALPLGFGAQKMRADSVTPRYNLNRKVERNSNTIVELTSHLPKGAIIVGKDLPATLISAVHELSALFRGSLPANALTTSLIVIRDMNRYLDYMGILDKTQRDVIKRYKTAFTINEQWPIYINGESELYSAAESRFFPPADMLVYKFVAVIAHEKVHAEGEPSEIKAIEGETRILQIFVTRGLVEVDWLIARKIKLAELINGKIPDEPLKVRSIRISPL